MGLKVKTMCDTNWIFDFYEIVCHVVVHGAGEDNDDSEYYTFIFIFFFGGLCK